MSSDLLDQKIVSARRSDQAKKVLFVSTLLSPFQIELVQEINRIAPFEYHVAFTLPFRAARGKHWTTARTNLEYVHCIDAQYSWAKQASWAAQLTSNLNPDVLLVGMFRRNVYALARRTASALGIKFGFWIEPPNFLRSLPLQWVNKLLARRRLREADLILAIGDRTERFARTCTSHPECVHLVPYAQNLSLFLSIPRPSDSSVTRFLFSGQLVKRHNVTIIAEALTVLQHKRPGRFRVIIAAHGPEESVIQRAIRECPALETIISYDREYSVWEDRVRPFSNSDVLIYPSSHSGWGLVVPEAMAAGIVVISTRQVEAARYYLRHRINGIVIEPKLNQLITELEWCIDHRELVSKMGQQARLDARWGAAEVVAEQFVDVLQSYI